jgi:diguanylate cyclase (GGDEF)-like protein
MQPVPHRNHALASVGREMGTHVPRSRLLDVIESIGKVMTVSRSLQSVMDVVADECARLTGADGATIFMLQNNRLTAKAAVGIVGFAMLDVPMGNSLPSHAVRQKQTVRCLDSKIENRTLQRMPSNSSSQSSVSAPFVFGPDQEIAGVLHVASTARNGFTREDEEIIQIYANLMGYAIQNAMQYDQAVRESREDPLTGVLNRRAFDEHLRMLKKEQIFHQQHHCLMFYDVDRLKAINDHYGHPVGDEALRLVAFATRVQLRKSDVVYRLGGDEFAVLMPQTRLPVARAAAHRIEAAVHERRIKDWRLSISTGVCEADPNESIPRLITRADQLLYRSKRERIGSLRGKSTHGHPAHH